MDKMLQWIDDFLIYATSEQELLDNMETIFTVCEEVNFRVNAKKSNFYIKEAKFCGKIFSDTGIRFDAGISIH